MCQYRQHRTSNSHKAEFKNNTLMVNPIKDRTKINLHDPCLLPTLQCILQCMGHTQKYITGTQTFPTCKLGGWKPTTAFHKTSETNRHQELKHLRQYWCYVNRSVIGNRGGGWSLRIVVALACLQHAWKLPKRTSRRNTTLWRGAITSAFL